MSTELIQSLLDTDRQYGELAGGPNFVLDLRLFPNADAVQNADAVPTELTSDDLYAWVQKAYDRETIEELTLEANHVEGVCSTLERDRTSAYWSMEENDQEITQAEFLPWLQACFLAEDCYEIEESDAEQAHPYGDQLAHLEEFAAIAQPQLFGDAPALTLHTLTDVNNENTPYGVYLLMGAQQTLLVITHWIL